MVERNMCNAVIARHCRPAGVEGHITRKRIASAMCRPGPHREGEEPQPMMHGRGIAIVCAGQRLDQEG